MNEWIGGILCDADVVVCQSVMQWFIFYTVKAFSSK